MRGSGGAWKGIVGTVVGTAVAVLLAFLFYTFYRSNGRQERRSPR